MTEKAAAEGHDRSDDELVAGEDGAVGQRDGPSSEAESPEALEEVLAAEEFSGELERLREEFDILNDRHLRLAAEFSNYRRRQETEMTEAWGRAQADLVRRLLDVLDDLQRVSALDPADESVTAQTIVEGVDLVERKFLRAIEDAGVEVIAPDGEAFDPETMEAMMRVGTDSEDDDDRVAGVLQKGYRLRGHLVRPARVSVFKVE
jgi:molecular chaperone GrpE